MKNILKMFAVLCLFACSAFAFAAKKSIVCVTYPEYDWVMNILGEKSKSFDVTLIQNNGTDLHSYPPSVKDVAKINQSVKPRKKKEDLLPITNSKIKIFRMLL